MDMSSPFINWNVMVT